MILSVGIIGYGRIGARHAEWINQSGSAHVAGIVDGTPARRALAKARGMDAFEQDEALLNDPSIDAILISLPTSLHFDHAARALRADKHVMVEKPMTLNLPEAVQLLELARQRNRVLSVFHNRRWDADYLAVLSAVQSGVFGRIINVESRLGQWSSCVGPAAKEWRPQWRNERAFGGGGLYDWGSHFLDQIWQLMLPAKPTRLFAQLRSNVWSEDCDDFARVSIDFDNGAVGLVEINTTTTRPLPRWHIDGTKGSAESPHSLEFDVKTWSKLQFTTADSRDTRLLPQAAAGLTEAQIWSRFAAACYGKGEPAVSAESALTTMSLLDAARQSSQSGNAVELT